MIKAEKPENTFEYELCPSGTHLARIFKIINIGTIKETWEGKEKDSHKIRIYWELPKAPKVYEVEKDGKKETVNSVFSISQEYTLSFGDRAKLRPIVVGILGKDFATEDEAWGFDIESLLGKSCLLNVTHRKSKDGEREYAIVASASTLMEGMKEEEPVNEQKILDVNTITDKELESLYESLRDKLQSSSEWKARQSMDKAKSSVADYPEDNINPEDIPF